MGYYEASDVSSSISRIPGFRAALTGPSGQDVPLQLYGNRSDGKVKKLTYQYNGHNGAAAFQFTAPAKGTYQVRVAAVDSLPPDADVAIGRDIAGGTVAGAILIIVGVLFLIAAIVLLVVGLVKRRRHRSQLAAGAAPAYGPGFGAGYAGGPQPGPPPGQYPQQYPPPPAPQQYPPPPG